MNSIRMALTQVRWQNKVFWRNPAAAFFIFAFPLVLMVILTTLFGSLFELMTLPTGQQVTPQTYYTASSLSFAVITACYMNLGLTTTFMREEGILKRIRGTPLPASSYLGAKIIHAVLVMLILVLIVFAFGAVFYDVELPWRSLPAFFATLFVGAAVFSSLGLAISSLTPNVDAAPAITNGTLFPLLFVSGVFLPLSGVPRWIAVIGDIFPFKPFTDALTEGFLPPPNNPTGWSPADLLVVAAWGIAAMLFNARFFRWEPSR